MDVFRNVQQLMTERFTSAGQSNQFNTVRYTCQSCSFATTLTSIFGRLAQWLEQPAHNRSVLGSNPRASIIFFVKQVYCEKLPVETEFIFFNSTGSTPKACEARDAALPQHWQVTGRSWVRTPERPLFFTVSICSIFCTTTPYNFCIPLLSYSVCCSVCCGCFIIYKKQQ